MADEVPDLLRKMNDFLRRIWRVQKRGETFRQEMLEAMGERTSSFNLEEHEQRMEDIKREAEEHRREEKEFRDELLFELKRQSALLVRLLERFDKPAERSS